MSLNLQGHDSAYSGYGAASAATPADDIEAQAHWRERVVTVVATSLAVTVVAVIAVLMGMA